MILALAESNTSGAGFGCPNIWHSPIPLWQLQESLQANNLLHRRLVDTRVKTLPK
jgi:hypothetical protein